MEDIVEAKVDPASYDVLAGKYAYPNGQTMTVTRDASHLLPNEQPAEDGDPA